MYIGWDAPLRRGPAQTDAKGQVQNTQYQVQRTKYQVPSTRYQVPGTRYQVTNTKYQIPDNSIPYRTIPVIRNFVPYYNLVPQAPVFFLVVMYPVRYPVSQYKNRYRPLLAVYAPRRTLLPSLFT